MIKCACSKDTDQQGIQSSYIEYLHCNMSAHVLLNLLNKLGKSDKMRGLSSILSLFRNEFNKFINTETRMLDSIYHMTQIYIFIIAFLVQKRLDLAINTRDVVINITS